MRSGTGSEHDLAFLHTAKVQVEVFNKIFSDLQPGLRVRHIVAEDLLAKCQLGITPGLISRVQGLMAEAATTGAGVVVCTCSTIGDAAESTAGPFHSMRIDRPMSDAAVTRGGRVLLVAALASTVEPSLALLKDSARRAGREIDVSQLLVQGAWSHFENGDKDAYFDAVAMAVEQNWKGFDVVVLAQASMAPAAERCRSVKVPVLSSPVSGVKAAIKEFVRRSMAPFLASTEVIDWQHPEVTARARELAAGAGDPLEKARRCFIWVRDEIKHSRDHNLTAVTCSASEVLREGSGYCFAKSHLLAALLRANNIPAGLCYQRLSRDGDGAPYTLHGLNSIWLDSFGWYRVDPRGNKTQVDAQFDPPVERLAFRATALGEVDLTGIFADPMPVVLQAIRTHSSAHTLWEDLPDVAGFQTDS